jgi:hypothetical protein
MDRRVKPGDDEGKESGIGLDFVALPDHSPPNFDWEGA